MLQDRPEELDQKDCSVDCWALSVAAVAAEFARRQSPAILAVQIPRCWRYLGQQIKILLAKLHHKIYLFSLEVTILNLHPYVIVSDFNILTNIIY